MVLIMVYCELPLIRGTTPLERHQPVIEETTGFASSPAVGTAGRNPTCFPISPSHDKVSFVIYSRQDLVRSHLLVMQIPSICTDREQ